MKTLGVAVVVLSSCGGAAALPGPSIQAQLRDVPDGGWLDLRNAGTVPTLAVGDRTLAPTRAVDAGPITVRIDLDEKGKVYRVAEPPNVPMAVFAPYAAVLHGWKFTPYLLGTTPVASSTSVTIVRRAGADTADTTIGPRWRVSAKGATGGESLSGAENLSGPVTYQICRDAGGHVDEVTRLEPADRPKPIDDSNIEKLKSWRFAPIVLAGQAVPYCERHTFSAPGVQS